MTTPPEIRHSDEIVRERTTVEIDRRTGDFAYSRELLPLAALDQRARELASLIPHDAEQVVLQIRCNGCGNTESLDVDNPTIPAGWSESANGDFCPHCYST